MKNKLLSVCLVLMVLAIEPLWNSSYSQDAYNLRFKFEKGKTYLYKSGTEMNMTQQMMGNEMIITSDVNIKAKFETKNTLENGNYELITYLDSGTVRSSFSGKDTTLSLKDFLGKRMRLIVSPGGNVLSREVIDSIAANNTFYTGRENVPLPALPSNEVKIGDSWKEQRIDTVGVMGGKMIKQDSTQYKITGRENKLGYNCLVIEFSTNSVMEGKGAMSGMNFTMEGTGVSSGKNYFAPAEGLFVNSESVAENNISMSATGQQNLIIPISQKLTTNISLVEVK